MAEPKRGASESFGTSGLQGLEDLIARQQPGHALERPFYSDPGIYLREQERVFPRHWLYVGHHSQIPDRGDYFVFEIAQESVILVRGEDGEIRALVNVCRHRGSRRGGYIAPGPDEQGW